MFITLKPLQSGKAFPFKKAAIADDCQHVLVFFSRHALPVYCLLYSSQIVGEVGYFPFKIFNLFHAIIVIFTICDIITYIKDDHLVDTALSVDGKLVDVNVKWSQHRRSNLIL